MPNGVRSHIRRLIACAPDPAPDDDPATPTFTADDVHGGLEALVDLLRDARLLDAALRWSGGDARVWFVGDLVDRGPDGIGAVDLVRRLEQEGDVHCLLGNHE